jgi:hypothetical protein
MLTLWKSLCGSWGFQLVSATVLAALCCLNVPSAVYVGWAIGHVGGWLFAYALYDFDATRKKISHGRGQSY